MCETTSLLVKARNSIVFYWYGFNKAFKLRITRFHMGLLSTRNEVHSTPPRAYGSKQGL